VTDPTTGVAVKGYEPASYGDAMADVYDEWYAELPQLAAAVECLFTLAGDGTALELGVGTGRLALPLVARGVPVVGVDASATMIERLRAKPGGDKVVAFVGDMAASLPAGPFTLAFAAVNTFFGLDTEQAQADCFASVAARLTSGGCVAIEAFVPDTDIDEPIDNVAVRDLSVDRVVLEVSRSDPVAQTAEGHYVELTERGGVRLRPWRIRWATPDQLDAYAEAAGLRLESRWAGWDGKPFTADSPQHVSIWRR
jgi:SAM-dependent methyltransferase